ncbi:TonB-dependent receptor [Sphingomonas sp. ABOLD]|uniref:Iron complex outermembrane receptor protein n=2 Tax=Sphingomonas trueperi TaxID=53317 RepID=A0A7X5XYL0_9SPHN|nr:MULTISPECIES: TonB-dependent receptor [Sphingomonas]NJB97749.1 iron complex outermembrane receptor protein [Sphingomonas trueperi]RSV52941.1 TonB-dependent receptor [Sphingomonas sp. ABOLD]
MHVSYRRTACSLAALALAMGMAAAPAFAQDAATGASAAAPQDDIVVTGSRIRRSPLDQDKPVVTVGQEEIARTGLTAIADVLQRLPSAAGGLNTKVNNAGNVGGPPDGTGVSSGSAEVDLRYLAAKRTLILVDGLRFVNGSAAGGIPASVDLNTLPVNLIERVEVLQSGASPLYGSDAVAGVINIITKQAQEGLRASAQYGMYRQGDGDTQQYEASYGIQSRETGTSLVFGASYVKQGSVSTGDRAISRFPNPGQTACTDPIGGCSGTPPNGRFAVLGQTLALRAPVSGRPSYPADFKPFTAADRYNFAPLNYLLTPSERYGGFVNFKQALTDSINMRVKLLYNHRYSRTQAAYLPLNIGPDAGNGNLLDTISVDVTNPYNPFGVTLSSGADGSAANYSFIARRMVEAGQRVFTQNVDTMSGTVTFDGAFDVGGRKWYWDVNGTFGINDAKQLFTGNLNAARLAQALGPVSACTGACVPFNLFGGLGSITPAMLDYVAFDERDRSSQRMWDTTANLSGTLFDLPAGPVGVAIGYEHRDQFASYDPDPVITAGLGADVPTSPARGGFDVDEIYGELRVPILANTPFFNKLELDGAVRHSNYSSFGSNTTFTASGLWKPVADLLLRGGYAESLRAPSIGELYAGLSRFDATIDDPCTSAAGGSFASNATVRANCIANGVPANGSYNEPTGGQLGVFSQGNTALKPETAKTWTAGGVYSPDWAKAWSSAFSLEVNYYNIKLDNAIDSVPATLTLRRCAFNADPVSCAAIRRTSSGTIAGISGRLLNLNGIRTDGLDGTLTFRTHKIGEGTIGLNANAAYLLRYDVVPPADLGAPALRYAGTERGSPDQAYPRFKGNATLDWSSPGYGIAFTARYISGVDERDDVHRLGAVFYGDFQAYFSPAWMNHRTRLTLGVNNLFDRAPPACFTCQSANFDPTTYDLPGQFGYLRLSFGF